MKLNWKFRGAQGEHTNQITTFGGGVGYFLEPHNVFLLNIKY